LIFFPKKWAAQPTYRQQAMSDADTFDAAIPSDRESAMNAAPTTDERVAALYESHRDRIYGFLVGQGLVAAKAQELVQDVFLKLFVALTKGSDIESEQAWLYNVASKLAVDHWRREGRPMWVELDAVPAMTENLRSKELTPEAAAVRDQTLKRVASTLACLPKEQRLGVHLRMQGLRYREIAKILGVSVPTVSGLLSTAVERLRSTANE
jgi:RNA polymerase sigma-70 factor (ECF subfamily)